MNRLAAGVEYLDPVNEAPYDDQQRYNYSVQVGSSDIEGVKMVTVTVKQAPGTAIHPISFALSRWVVDPEYAQQLADQSRDEAGFRRCPGRQHQRDGLGLDDGCRGRHQRPRNGRRGTGPGKRCQGRRRRRRRQRWRRRARRTTRQGRTAR